MSSQNDDFDLMKSIEVLSAHINQPNKFADIFYAAAKTQKKIDDTLKECVLDLFKKDIDLINTVKQIIHDHDKASWRWLFKKIGFAAWSVLIIFITILATTFCNNYFGIHP